MENGETEQWLINIVFVGMYLLIGGVWFAFYNFQGQDSIFNSGYDYWTLLVFQVVSGCMLIGYARLTQSLWVMYFLCGCGLLTLPILIQGYKDALSGFIPFEALINTRLTVVWTHITTYTIIAIQLVCTYKEKQKRRLI